MKSTNPDDPEETHIAIPLVDDAIEFEDLEATPSWRGWIHAGTFPLAIVLGIVLMASAEGAAAKAGSAVFFTSSLLLFGTSALYHRIAWSAQTKAIFRRIDHANVFLLIAGTYTPMSVLCLSPEKAALLLWFIWGGAALGIGFRIFWIDAPRWSYVPVYVLLGWAAMVFIVDFFQASWIAMTLILAGGIFYSIGAAVYGLKQPNPFPGSFGFHEVFHSLTLLAFVCHWVGVFIVTTNPPMM